MEDLRVTLHGPEGVVLGLFKLVEQVTGRVRWRESVAAMHEDGVGQFVELGGKVLTPMIRKIAGEAETASLITMEELEEFAKGL